MTRILWTLSLVCIVTFAAGPALAAEVETREFQVKVDGKPAGEYRQTIQHDNGTYTITCQAEVRVRYFVVNYVYTFRGTEIWKDGRLVRLDSKTTDDKKRYDVSASASGDRLRVRANGVEHSTRGDAWTTTYWRLAPAKFRNQSVPLVDADTGRDIGATLQYVGANSIVVNGQPQNCAHYRVTGGVQVDLWYDAQERMVRQESIEDGHRTLLELTRISR